MARTSSGYCRDVLTRRWAEAAAQQLFGVFATAAAIVGDPQPSAQLFQCGNTLLEMILDVALGDRVADAEIHMFATEKWP